MYSSGRNLEWRIVEGGNLPSARSGLRATLASNTLYVSGGKYDYNGYLTTILSWDPVTESWQTVADLNVARYSHAAVAIQESFPVVKC